MRINSIRLFGSMASWLVLLGSTLGEPALAAPQWQPIGPAPPAIEATMAVDRASGTVYIGSLGGGVFKSTDGGKTFLPLEENLGAVSALVMSPDDPNRLVVATGTSIFKSSDGGATWALGGDPGGLPLAMVMDPTDPNVLYAGLNGDFPVIKSTDGGENWFPASDGIDGDPVVFSLAIDPHDPQVIFAGTAGAGAYRSSDGGVSWTALNIDTSIWALLVDPQNSRVVYAGTNGHGVFRSTDGGGHFTRVGSPKVGVIFALGKSGHRLYAGTATQGFSVSEDDGKTWVNANVSNGLGLTITVDRAGAVYVGTNFTGAFRLQPGAAANGPWQRLAWNELKACNCQNGHAIVVDPSRLGHVLFSTNDGGLLETRDGGQTWIDGGQHGLIARAPRGIAFDPQAPRYVYAGSFAGGGFFRSADHGAHWQRRQFGSSTIYVAGVAVDPVDHTVYVSSFRTDDGVWKSVDFGKTFSRVDRAPGAAADEFINLSGRGITVDPQHHRTVYLAGPSGIWRSRNAGETWFQLKSIPSFSITVDPRDSHFVYVGTSDRGVLASSDGGASFPAGQGLPRIATARTGAIQIDPNHRNVLYVGTIGEGVFRSMDRGKTWKAINAGLDDLGVLGLAMDPNDPNVLYASTLSSVYKTENATQ